MKLIRNDIFPWHDISYANALCGAVLNGRINSVKEIITVSCHPFNSVVVHCCRCVAAVVFLPSSMVVYVAAVAASILCCYRRALEPNALNEAPNARNANGKSVQFFPAETLTISLLSLLLRSIGPRLCANANGINNE